jgi:hypothetical protein
MRRRWKALVVVAAVALFASLLFPLPPRDDGLDWIRKYGGKEIVRYNGEVDVNRGRPPETTLKWLEFKFDRIPRALLAEIQHRSEKQAHDDRATVIVQAKERTIVVIQYHRPNWLQRKWRYIRLMLGLR